MGSSVSTNSSYSYRKKGSLKSNATSLRRPTAHSLNVENSQTSSDQSAQATSERVFKGGREFHNDTKSAYWFPIDDEEQDRLVGEHFAIKALFEGNVPREIVEKYSSVNAQARILDVGCGPGTWIMDVATEFPNCELVGIDMIDIFPSDIRPSNVSFKLNNVLDGISFPDNSFDAVHFRFFNLALRSEEWLPVLKEIYRVLKPGGVVVSKEPRSLSEGNEFFIYVGKAFVDKMIANGQDPSIDINIERRIEEAGFDVIKHEYKHVDLSKPESISREFSWNLKMVCKSAQPYLADQLGVPHEHYGAFLERLDVELKNKPACVWTFSSTVGRKPLSNKVISTD
ncbi:S-adenosyl-L-methionine-dependent methyltransferase [Blakeslea trispora]|nr:S-adenosyl-L-methionine-dependent methyltransferase [Blakeslea trispora]